MFGHERGAVTGARTAYVGLVEQAGDGTLFFDEVSALPPAACKGKLLRLVEDGSYQKGRRHVGTCIKRSYRVVEQHRSVRARGEWKFQGRPILPAERDRTAYPAVTRAARGHRSYLPEHYLAQFARGAGHRACHCSHRRQGCHA